MNYLMSYDNEGNIITFYPTNDLASYHDIPAQIIEITQEKYDFYHQKIDKYKLNPQTLQDELIPYVEPLPQPKTELEILKETIDMLVLSSLGV